MLITKPDTKTYTEEPLLYDGLRQFHGPALLARNNRIFTDKDFASLASIGDSRKRHDLAATGKFGQGFNSVRPTASSVHGLGLCDLTSHVSLILIAMNSVPFFGVLLYLILGHETINEHLR